MPKWRNEYRRCDNCRCEYRPQREAQSYCNRDCRRAAAYARERFKAGTKGRRKRRLEASDKLPFPQLNQETTDRRIGSKNSIKRSPVKSTGLTGLSRSASGLLILWAALDTALGGQPLPSILSCVRPSSKPSGYSKTTSRAAMPPIGRRHTTRILRGRLS